jgi:hypothetical protein
MLANQNEEQKEEDEQLDVEENPPRSVEFENMLWLIPDIVRRGPTRVNNY